MSAGIPLTLADGQRKRRERGFTLVELLVVMAVVASLLALVVPAFTQANTARTLTTAAYNVAGLLENARAYAKANNTYTWVGFFEEAPTGAAGTAGVGRVVVFAVSSKDATALYANSDPDPAALPATRLNALGKLTKIDNTHLTVLNTNEVPARGKVTDGNGVASNVDPAYQVGDGAGDTGGFSQRSGGTNRATFTYPLGAANPTYKFVRVIQFNPLGDATKIVDSPTPLIEIGLRPTRGTTVEVAGKNCAAVQVDGIGGLVRIYRP